MFHINRQKIHREAPSVVETIINSVRTRCVNKGKANRAYCNRPVCVVL